MDISKFFKEKQIAKVDYKALKRTQSIEHDEVQELINKEKNHPYWQRVNPQGDNYSPEQYNDAINIWNNFIDYYGEFCTDREGGFSYAIPSLDCLVGLAPIIGDAAAVNTLLDTLPHMVLPSYNLEALLNTLKRQPIYDKFFKKYVTNEPQKQVDLVKVLRTLIPNVDGGLYFYILRQFKLVTVTKQGRYNIISRPDYDPQEAEQVEEEVLSETEQASENESSAEENVASTASNDGHEGYIDLDVNDGAKSIVVNYAMQQNGYSPITKIVFRNAFLEQLEDVQLILSFDPAMISEKTIEFGNVAALTNVCAENIPLVIKPSVLLNITEKITGVMTIEVKLKDESVGTREYPIEFLAYNEWSGTSLCPEMLAAFVTPNHPYVSAVLSSASKVLREWGKSPAFEGYQGDVNRVLEQIAAIYTALRRQKIVYNNPPASFEGPQRIKLPHKVLQEKKGTCLDLSVLFCACIEAAGMHPILFIKKSHAFAGCWLDDKYFTGGYCDDYTAVSSVTLGNNCSIAMVNSVTFCLDNNITFDESWKSAEHELVDRDEFDYVLDIAALRMRESNPIRPIPLAMNTDIDASMFDIQDNVNIVEAEPEKLEVVAPVQSTPEDEVAHAKQRYWETKLLDLSLANPLISLFKTKIGWEADEKGNKQKAIVRSTSALEIFVPNIGTLEDRLADGLAFNLRADLGKCLHSEEVFVTYKKVLKDIEFDKNNEEEAALAARKAQNIALGKFLENSFSREQLFLSFNINDGEKRLKNCAKAASHSVEENGANTLYLALGIMRWFQEPLPDKKFKSEAEVRAYINDYIEEDAQFAPLLLLPVDLERNTKTNSFTLRSRQEETQINITLLEFLKQNYGIEIAGLDPLPLDAHGIDLPLILNQVRNAIKDCPFWEILDDAYLGHFSFAKFVMWNDIHNHAEEMAENKVVNSLLHGCRMWTPHCDAITEDDIENISDSLNMIVPSSADSSQLVAIATALSEESMVLQGPPGTGKSQTITNLIANALFNDKTVLFVAEKKAALDVVKRRLDGMGLANYCLSMHSDDTNKMSVLERLNKTTEAGYLPFKNEDYEYTLAKVHELRAKLNDIINALHGKRAFGCSLYQAISILKQNIQHKNTIKFNRSAFKGIVESDLLKCEELLREYKSALREMGNGYDTTLTGYQGTEYSLVIREKLALALADLTESRESVLSAWATLQAWCNIITAENAEKYLDFLNKLAEHRTLLQCITTLTAWEQARTSINDYLQKLAQYKKDEDGCAQYFDIKVLDLNFAAAKTAWEFAGNAYDGTRQRLHAELQGYAKPGVIIQEAMMVYNYNYLAGIAAKRAGILQLGENVKATLGYLYQGTSTNIEMVRAALEDTQRFCAEYAEFEAQGLKLNATLVQQALGNTKLQTSKAVVQEFLQDIQKLTNTYSITFEKYSDAWLENIYERSEHIAQNLGKLRGRTAYNRVAEKLRTANMQPVIEAVETGKVTLDNLEPAFLGSVYYNLVMLTVSEDSRLAEFYGMKYNEMILRYREIIDEYQKLCVKELVQRLKKKVFETVRGSDSAAEITILYKAIMNKGRNKPMRKLFTEIQDILPRLCPCMLMNPISVAQYIDIGFPKFDLVIFDEASQIPTSEAIGAIARGKDAIVVGDPKQMPPTNFFGTNVDTEDNDDVKDMESLLIDCQTIQMPTKELKWHYRSQHESLIAFSNAKYYGSNLYTFPTPNDLVSEVKIVHPVGFYDRKSGTNKAEAEAIVAEIIRRYRNPELRQESIGVIAFNTKQQGYIEDMLEKTLALPENEDLIEYDILKNVFVKNLESVQGDEADVILFSIGFAPDKNGKMLMNFGPLNRDGGWRRLNVAISRSRKSMIIYSVLRPEQISSSVTAQGVLNLKEFLAYAENRKSLRKNDGRTGAVNEVPYLVQEISTAIEAMGFEVKCDVGSSEFKMDIGVINPFHPEIYLMGILIDSENCKEAATARDRFVLQPSILKGLGWKLVRLWILDWLDDAERIKEQLHTAIQEQLDIAKARYDEEQAKVEQTQQEIDNLNLSVAVAEVDPLEEEDEQDIEVTAVANKTLVATEDVPEESHDSDIPAETKPESCVSTEMQTETNTPTEVNDKQDTSTSEIANSEELATEHVSEKEEHVPQLVRMNRKGPKPYKIAAIKVQGEQADFYNEANLDKIAAIIEKIMAKEAPLSFNLLASRIMPLYGFARTSTKFYNTLNSALDRLNTLCTHDEERNFLWKEGQEPSTYDIYRNSEERNLEDIPAEEIVCAAYVALKENGPMYAVDLYREVNKRFNGGRFTKKVEGVITYAMSFIMVPEI